MQEADCEYDEKKGGFVLHINGFRPIEPLIGDLLKIDEIFQLYVHTASIVYIFYKCF